MNPTRSIIFIALVAALTVACQASDPVDVSAEESTTTLAVDTSPDDTAVDESADVDEADEGEESESDAEASDDEADFAAWYAEVDATVDTFALTVNEELDAAFDRLVEGERDFIVFGALHEPQARLARDALASLPEPVGDPAIDGLYADFVDAIEAIAVFNEGAALIYEDLDEYETQWNTATDDQNMFAERDEAQLAFEDSCLALMEIGLERDQGTLDCFGSENAVESESTGEFEILQVGDSVDLQIGDVALTYEATVTTERADWGDDWLAVNDEPDFLRTWWFGAPNGLADPDGELVPDTVIDPIPFSLDLDSWVGGIDQLTLVDTASGEVGGLPARSWDVRIDVDALGPRDIPVIALVDAEFGAPVGGLQLGFEAVWRMWTIDHPSGPVLWVQTAFIDPDVMEAAFNAMTEEQLESGGWPEIDEQLYLDAFDSLDGYENGFTFPIE